MSSTKLQQSNKNQSVHKVEKGKSPDSHESGLFPYLEVISDNMEFGNVYGIGICTLHFLSGCHNDIFVSNQILDISTCFHNGILHENTVFYFSTFGNFNASGENTVLYFALDKAAVSNHYITYGSSFYITVGVSSRTLV